MTKKIAIDFNHLAEFLRSAPYQSIRSPGPFVTSRGPDGHLQGCPRSFPCGKSGRIATASVQWGIRGSQAIALDRIESVGVIAVGKAAPAMAEAVPEAIKKKMSFGMIVTTEGYERDVEGFEVVRSGGPQIRSGR